MKIATVIPVFILGKTEPLKNCRPISVLSCFSKILEQVMYNRFSKYLGENKLLYSFDSEKVILVIVLLLNL